MSVTTILVLILGLTAQKPEPRSIDFAIRADPRYAEALSRVLQTVADPALVTLPPGQTAADYFQSTCGTSPPAGHSERLVDDRVELSYLPCVRVRLNARATVLRNGRLEAMAIRFGLSPAAVSDLTLLPAPGTGRSGPILPTELQPGDIVVAPRAADWTMFSAPRTRTPDRAALARLLADALDCEASDADACLNARRVQLIEVDAQPTIHPASPAAETSEIGDAGVVDAVAMVAALGDKPALSLGLDFEETALASYAAFPDGLVSAGEQGRDEPQGPAFALDAAALPANDEPSGEEGAPTSSPTRFLTVTAETWSAASVAPGQWPYDRARVAQVLEADRRDFGPRVPTRIGVADGGLADRYGAPLPPEMFDHIEPDDPMLGDAAEPDDIDDDDNRIIDDLVGSGVLRNGLLPDGDVGFCDRTPLDVADWPAKAKAAASHGALVAGLAGGLPLRRAYPSVRDQLPVLQFYRLVQNACEAGDPPVAARNVEMGYSFLTERTEIIVLPMLDDSRTPLDSLTNAIERNASRETNLLFLPAGNEGRDLDRSGALLCPACLADPDRSPAARAVVVVGAAGQDLRPLADTAWGSETVRLFAPGETLGLLDIAGNVLEGPPSDSAYLSATSYAAPHAAFAAGLIFSSAPRRRAPTAATIRDRLMLSTWAMQDAGEHARAVDLLKVASVWRHAVEVMEEHDGRPVLRTYVGNLPSGLGQVCETRIHTGGLHALRLGAADAEGVRFVQLFRPGSTRRAAGEQTSSARCVPRGDLIFRDLDGVPHAFPWRAVTQVLFPWR